METKTLDDLIEGFKTDAEFYSAKSSDFEKGIARGYAAASERITANRAALTAGMQTSTSPEKLAELFHSTYEELAPQHGYQPRQNTSVPWDDVPEPNKGLMIATAKKILETVSIEAGMWGVLRFKIYQISEHSLQIDMLRVDGDMVYFEGLPFYTILQIDDMETGIETAKRIGNKFAKSLGLTAEFVDGDSDEQK